MDRIRNEWRGSAALVVGSTFRTYRRRSDGMRNQRMPENKQHQVAAGVWGWERTENAM